MWLHLVWRVLKCQATRAGSSWFRHLQRMPETQMLRSACHSVTSQTKQPWFLSLLLVRGTVSTNHKSQGLIWKYTSWNSSLSTHTERSLAEICFFFFWSFDKGDMEYEKYEKATPGRQGTSPGRTNYKSHGESHSFTVPWPLALQRETHTVGARRRDNGQWGSSDRTLGSSPNPALCFLFRTKDPIFPQLTPLPQPRASRVAHRLVFVHW